MNKAILIGRIGKDIELKKLQSGIELVKVSLATTENYKDGDVWNKMVEWHNLIFWKTNAVNASKVLSKGDLVSIEGNIKTRQWNDGNGITRNITEIHVHRFDKLVNKKLEAPAH